MASRPGSPSKNGFTLKRRRSSPAPSRHVAIVAVVHFVRLTLPLKWFDFLFWLSRQKWRAVGFFFVLLSVSVEFPKDLFESPSSFLWIRRETLFLFPCRRRSRPSRLCHRQGLSLCSFLPFVDFHCKFRYTYEISRGFWALDCSCEF